jgi:hypothetical protein
MVDLDRVFVLALVAVVGCGGESEAWGGRVWEEAGVIRVENPPTPLGGPGEISLALRWSQEGPESGEIWEAPRRVRVFRGMVYLTDRQASRVHRITSEGVLRSSFGEPGEGPGQYLRIIDAVPTEGGLFVVDGGNARVEVLDEAGDRIGSQTLGQVVYAAVPLTGGAIAVFGMLGTEERWTRIDASGGTQAVSFPDLEAPPGYVGPVSSASSWGGRLVRLRYTFPEMRVYSPGGMLERVIEIPLPVKEATDEEIEEIVQEVSSVLARDGLPSGVIQQQVAHVRSQFRQKLRFRKVEFDEEEGLAAIWEQNPEDFGSGNAKLHLLTVDGVYLGVVEADRPWADVAIDDGVLYTLSRDPLTDLVTLMAFDVLVSEGLLDKARSLVPAAGPGGGDGS